MVAASPRWATSASASAQPPTSTARTSGSPGTWRSKPADFSSARPSASNWLSKPSRPPKPRSPDRALQSPRFQSRRGALHDRRRHIGITPGAVTVKVPRHRELVSAALAAGKAVYCEWPLGRDLDDARAMAALAADQSVRTVVGLQGRKAPAIEFVEALVRDGYVGEVLSTTMVGLSIPGDAVVKANAYMLDKKNGANLLTIAMGHSLDTLSYVLGEFADLSAVSDLRRPLIRIEDTGEEGVKTAGDQIAVIGTLTSGATASVHGREAGAGGHGWPGGVHG